MSCCRDLARLLVTWIVCGIDVKETARADAVQLHDRLALCPGEVIRAVRDLRAAHWSCSTDPNRTRPQGEELRKDASMSTMDTEPEIMDEETLAFRRVLQRFGSPVEKKTHLSHRGKVKSESGFYQLTCECGARLGNYEDR